MGGQNNHLTCGWLLQHESRCHMHNLALKAQIQVLLAPKFLSTTEIYKVAFIIKIAKIENPAYLS